MNSMYRRGGGTFQPGGEAPGVNPIHICMRPTPLAPGLVFKEVRAGFGIKVYHPSGVIRESYTAYFRSVALLLGEHMENG
jgi:hypothetical protein